MADILSDMSTHLDTIRGNETATTMADFVESNKMAFLFYCDQLDVVNGE